MTIYFDNAATTCVCVEAAKAVMDAMETEYGNPSAMHKKGVEAEKIVNHAGEIIADALKAKRKEIIFTSGGSESNNLALMGAALAARRRGKHIITTALEHPSVLEPLRFLEEEGYEITRLMPDSLGIVSPKQFSDAIRSDTILCSCMFVNNEIGSVLPVHEIGTAIKEKDPGILFHVDAIQAFGKIPVIPKNGQMDMVSVSGHKIHGPKGVGFLYQKEGTRIQPLILGGGQQNGMRAGTENVPGIAGLCQAVIQMCGHLDEKSRLTEQVKNHFCERIKEIDQIQDHSGNAPHISSISFGGIRSEVLLHALEDRGIYVSSGSACSSNKKKASGTLKAIGLADPWREGTLRFSFSAENTTLEVDQTIEALKEIVPMLRKFTRR